jgi:outer membrane receptor for ferrienterochelin and colicin
MTMENGVGGYYFYDLNAKVNWDFNDKNKLYLSGYFGRDKFYMKYQDSWSSLNSEYNSGFFWQNATATLRWNHLFNTKLFNNTSLIYSNYNLNLYEEYKGDVDFYKLRYLSGIRDFSLKTDFNYFPNPNHYIRYGLLATYHQFKPSALTVNASLPEENMEEITTIGSFETGVYVEDEAKFGAHFRLNPGLRLSSFSAKNKTYFGIEPRLNSSYILDDVRSVKASFAMMNQYIHLLSNTGLGLPTDLWVPSTDNIKPQSSTQVAIGFAQDIPAFNLTFTVESYYKWMNNIVGYKEGASFLIFDDPETANDMAWEENITAGKGTSYGIEFLLQRKQGKFSGWIGYTLSWTKNQFPELNFGKEFYANYDRRHDLSVVGIYEINKHITLSATWVYASGNPTTIPTATYMPTQHSFGNPTYMPWNYMVSDYGERNSFRMSAYHRFDLSLQFHKQIRLGMRTFEIGIYNLYNRKNPFFYFLDTDYSNGVQTNIMKQVTLFPIIPSFTYSIKF